MINYNLRIETLSPVHIGSGTELQPFEYYTDNNILYKLRIDRCFDFVFNNDVKAIAKFDEWINTEITRQVHRVDKKEYYGIFNFVGKTLKNPQLLEKLCSEIKNNPKYYEYKIPIAKIEKNKNVKQLLKTASNEVYLPGSSIKGMLRTALLNYVLISNNNIVEELNKQLKSEFSAFIPRLRNARNKIKEFENFKRKLLSNFEANLILGCGFSKYNSIQYDDAKYDLFKFIQVTDTEAVPTEEIAYIAQASIKKTGIDNQKNHKFGKQPLPAIEVVKSGSIFNSRISIDTDYIKHVTKNSNNDKWIDFRGRFELVFGKDTLQLSSNELAERIIIVLEDALNSLMLSLLNSDSRWIESTNSFGNIQELLNSISDDAVAFKLGFGCSIWSKTVLDSLALAVEQDLQKTDDISILDIFGANGRNIDSSDTSVFTNFPKTRTIVNDGRTNHLMGWVDLRFENIN